MNFFFQSFIEFAFFLVNFKILLVNSKFKNIGLVYIHILYFTTFKIK